MCLLPPISTHPYTPFPDPTLFPSQLNPAVNVASVFDNGPYVIFAPTNEAFAALPPEQLAMLRADPAAPTQLVYYHAFLGLLGTDDVKGQRRSDEHTSELQALMRTAYAVFCMKKKKKMTVHRT